MATSVPILDVRGKPFRKTRKRNLRASYDAARTNDDNRKHWANADALSAFSANIPEVRRTLRMRSRYEIANNSYARGIVNTLANHTIGVGPLLQLRTENEAVNTWVEDNFCLWANEIGFPEKLRLMKMAKTQDGETFAIETENKALTCPVQMDLWVVEADQIATPSWTPLDNNVADGIEFDQWGNPAFYHVLRQHPGDMVFVNFGLGEYDRVPAKRVIHLQHVVRPGQKRGIPEITPSLRLFAELRRFMEATIRAAETAADMAGVLQTKSEPPDEDEMDENEAGYPAFDTVEIEKGTLMTVPATYELSQLRAEHPATTYEMFVRCGLKEIGRCLSMPYNVVAGDSSQYNYASGRLDHQVYFNSIEVEQSYFCKKLLNRVLMDWLYWAFRINFMPAAVRSAIATMGLLQLVEYSEWLFIGAAHVDPLKEANADDVQIKNGTKSRSEVLASRGKDWVKHFNQLKREKDLAETLGLEFEEKPQPAGAPRTQAETDTTLEEEEVYSDE